MTVPQTPIVAPAAVLILHGIADRLEYWHAVQDLLAANLIPSLVFDYSGYGRSSGAITPANLDEDAQAAAAYLRTALPEAALFLLGYSMGTAIAAAAAPQLDPPAAGMILCQSFTTLREAAAAFAPAPLSRLLPDIWRTKDLLRSPTQATLLVHGDADELFPHAMSRVLKEASGGQARFPVELVVPRGFTHNQAYLQPSAAYWQPILDFISAQVILPSAGRGRAWP